MSAGKPDTEAAERGFTLLELIVVLAVFALVATMSLQAMTGTLRTRDRLVKVESQTAEITRVLALLRADLQAAVPLEFHDVNGQIQSSFEIAQGSEQLAFSVSGRFALPGEQSAGLGRVIWRFDRSTQQVLRQSWPTLIPADRASLSPEVVVATGISGFDVRRLDGDGNWVSGPDDSLGAGTSSGLPRAVDVVIDTAAFGRISTLVGFR
ncbi:type II secretion system protein GspJ [Roseobacter sp. N2S]|uniref:type II secretion system protein GspJ n=1 Tax=Roseobacter sp. N2S TaxID=2663844 RepID=UPI0028605690|nr:type II secretion system protein GspJ [Roseobacter sp. N2S]MDR6267603.1 general secretion pathway protein J [Roseobacter sp. N2S]